MVMPMQAVMAMSITEHNTAASHHAATMDHQSAAEAVDITGPGSLHMLDHGCSMDGHCCMVIFSVIETNSVRTVPDIFQSPLLSLSRRFFPEIKPPQA